MITCWIWIEIDLFLIKIDGAELNQLKNVFTLLEASEELYQSDKDQRSYFAYLIHVYRVPFLDALRK